LGIIVLQANLQFDGFGEIALLLFCRVLEEVLDVLSNVGDRDFTTNGISIAIAAEERGQYLIVAERRTSTLGDGESLRSWYGRVVVTKLQVTKPWQFRQ
jgi:hypothetical protein